MGTKYPELFAALAAPIHRDFIKTRKHDGARYITARVVMNLLDTVLGPEGWNATYERWGDDAILCRLSITLPDGTVLTKCDVGSLTSMSDKNKQVDAGDDEKGGVSDSLKRAAVLFGIGRFLYNDGVPGYVDMSGGEVPNDPPAPQHRRESKWGGARPDQEHTPSAGPSRSYDDRPPTSGRAMYAWTKDQEQRHQVGLLKYLNEWSNYHEFPARMVDWDSEQVALAYAEAMRKLGNEDDRGDAYEDALSN